MALYTIPVATAACANGKIFLSILNTSDAQTVRVKKIRVINTSGAVNGILLNFDLLRITAITKGGGADVVPVALDPGDPAVANMTIVSNPDAITGSTIIAQAYFNNDDAPLTGELVGFIDLPLDEEVILRKNTGVALKQITNSAVGSLAILAVIDVQVD